MVNRFKKESVFWLTLYKLLKDFKCNDIMRLYKVQIGGNKMYLEDSPIKNQDQDLLHRRGFAKRLGKSLIEAETKEGYCVGLFGPWGSGKSSVVNMVIEEIKNLTKDNENKPIVMYFNPWNFSTSEQLIQQYFWMLADQFASSKEKGLKMIGDEIEKYAGMFDWIGTAGEVIKVGGHGLSRLLKYANRNSVTNSKDIIKQKELIVKKLEEQKQKIIIVIDDIDRLSNDEIKLIFQLVNTVAKFPNTIYLLSFDKEIVARALTEVQQYDGEKYLEKIIQVPIEIPESSGDCLWKALFEKLDEVLKQHDNMLFEDAYWGIVFSQCVSKYISNIRDIVRLINALSIKADMIGEEINFVDLVAITVIETKIPKLYRWIKENKSKLVGSKEEAIRLYNRKPEDIKMDNIKEMQVISKEEYQEYFDILNLLFPYYASKTNSGTYCTNDMLRRAQRIGHADLFKRYFSLEMDENAISRGELNYALNQMSISELESYLKRLNANDAIINFLKELSAAKNDISVGRIPILIKAIISKASIFTGEDKTGFFSMSAFSMVRYTVEELFKIIENEENRYVLFKDILEKADVNTLPFVSGFVNGRELAYGRLSENKNERGEKIFSLEHLLEFEKIFMKKLKTVSEHTCLLDISNSRILLYLYESFEAESFEVYMKNILRDDMNKMKYLAFSAEKWTSGSQITWRINNSYNRFLNDEIIKNVVKSAIENQSILNLSEKDLHGVIAFLLWTEKRVDWDGAVSDKDVIERIEEIKG